MSAVPAAARLSLEGRRVLVIGLSPVMNRNVVEPLLALGVAAKGTVQPDTATTLFNARDFELIVFGRGVLGPASDRLKRAFLAQSAEVRFVDAIGPVAVKQTLSALTHDPRVPRLISGLSVVEEDEGVRVEAQVFVPCRLALSVYRVVEHNVVPEVLIDQEVQVGRVAWQFDKHRLANPNSLLLVADDEEYWLHPFLGGG